MQSLNARNILCPLPVIRTQEKVNSMQAGEVLEVICTDPGALSDIPMWCRINGHTVLDTQQSEYEVIIKIEVGEESA